MKTTEKCQKSIYEHKVGTCSKLQRYGENIGDKKLSVEHTLTLFLQIVEKSSYENLEVIKNTLPNKSTIHESLQK